MRQGERPTCAGYGRVLLPAILVCMMLLAAVVSPGAISEASAQSPKHAPIRLVFSHELAPLSYVEDGKVKGIMVDVAEEVFGKRLGLDVIATGYPWQRAQEMVRDGEADGFITVATEERAEYANCGRVPVIRADLHPIVQRGGKQVAAIGKAKNLADLRPFAIVSYAGNGWAKQNLAGFNVFDAQNFQSSLRGVANGRGDLALGTAISSSYYMQAPDVRGKLEVLPLVVDTYLYVLCISKDSLHAAKLQEFERVLEVLRSDGGYAPILQRYGMVPETLY